MSFLARMTFLACALATCVVAFPNKSQGQKFLGFARADCSGLVTVDGTDLSVRPYESRAAALPETVTDNKIVWNCDKKPLDPVPCPAGTAKVLVDRTQGGTVVSLICLSK